MSDPTSLSVNQPVAGILLSGTITCGYTAMNPMDLGQLLTVCYCFHANHPEVRVGILDSLILNLKGHWSVSLDLGRADTHVNLLGEA